MTQPTPPTSHRASTRLRFSPDVNGESNLPSLNPADAGRDKHRVRNQGSQGNQST